MAAASALLALRCLTPAPPQPRAGYATREPPKVLHYGLEWHVEGTDYKFDKASSRRAAVLP